TRRSTCLGKPYVPVLPDGDFGWLPRESILTARAWVRCSAYSLSVLARSFTPVVRRVMSCRASGSSMFVCRSSSPAGRCSYEFNALPQPASDARATRPDSGSARIEGPSPAGIKESDPGFLMYDAL